MLKNIDPLLTGSLLSLLDRMGHGDLLGVVDRNFPAHRYGAPVIDFRGVDTGAAAQAILSVFPLDGFVDEAVHRMEIDGSPDEITVATERLQKAADDAEGRHVGMVRIGNTAFKRWGMSPALADPMQIVSHIMRLDLKHPGLAG